MKAAFIACLAIVYVNTSAQRMNKGTSGICGTSFLHELMLNSDPIYADRVNDFDRLLISNRDNSAVNAVTVVIPVVVHVMHKGEPVGTGTNISDEAIRDKIKAINEEFRHIEGTQGDGDGVDCSIEFALAVRGPDNACTSGITRTDMSSFADYMDYGVRLNGTLGMPDATLKALANWDSLQYYNIYTVSTIDTNIGGYAFMASMHGSVLDGTVIRSSSFADTTSTDEAHELGHGLNLYHTFEGDGSGATCPTNTNGCGAGVGDCCGDIPSHKRSDGCFVGTNSCDGNSNTSYLYNYMNYSPSSCKNMFTANQKTRMHAAVSTFRNSFLPTNGNNRLVPPDSELTLVLEMLLRLPI
ncbi:MAG TPA: M43 family zinc metalloprotease [Flavobacterium sp.]|jgi:hypothetical protein